MRPKTLFYFLMLTLLTGTVLLSTSEALSKVRPIESPIIRVATQLPTQMPSMPPTPFPSPPSPPPLSPIPTPISPNPTNSTSNREDTVVTPTPTPDAKPARSPTPHDAAQSVTPTPSPTPDVSTTGPGSWWPWIIGGICIALIILGVSSRRNRRN